MTRQRKLQLEYLRQGRCQSCGSPAGGKVLCDRCSGAKSRRRLPSEWARIDWGLSNELIADLMDVTVQAVHYQRRKFQKAVDLK